MISRQLFLYRTSTRRRPLHMLSWPLARCRCVPIDQLREQGRVFLVLGGVLGSVVTIASRIQLRLRCVGDGGQFSGKKKCEESNR